MTWRSGQAVLRHPNWQYRYLEWIEGKDIDLAMPGLKAGERFPDGIKFQRVPWKTPDPKNIGMPKRYNASEEWKNKKVVLVSVPGAFSPGCQGFHIPPYIEKLGELRENGVDTVAIIAYNDAWVMSAWEKVNGVKHGDILFMADTDSKFSQQIGWMAGERNSRWAMIIDKGIIKYAENESDPTKVSVSGVDAVLSSLQEKSSKL